MVIFTMMIRPEKRKQIEGELRNLPDGNLHLYHRGDRTYFYDEVDNKRRGISKDPELIYALARRKYLTLLLQKKAANDSRINKLLEHYEMAKLDISRITLSAEQYGWAQKDYRRNKMNIEDLIFETYSGIHVRSKSEQKIANEMEKKGVPYRYEMAVEIEVDWMQGVSGAAQGKYKTYYPDFVIMTSSGELIFWEHLGRMDIEGYRNHNMEKIAAYRQGGVCSIDQLILTYERDIQRSDEIERIIESRIIPNL